MKDEYFRYLMEAIYIKLLTKIHWWQFGKRKRLDAWRQRQIDKINDL